MSRSRKALLVIDVQRDFVEDGALEVAGGLEVAHKIHDYIYSKAGYRVKYASKDWHDPLGDNGRHFSDNPDYVDTWPAHCIASSPGAAFAGPLNPLMFDEVFHKGWNRPAYSAFEGLCVRRQWPLGQHLVGADILEIDVCGIATDYCVKATVLDALRYDYKVNVIADLTVAVGDKELALKEMEAAGATIVRFDNE